jgi:predicted membrane protein
MKAKQVTLGVLVIVAGLLILLSNINVAPVREFISAWWPVAIVIAGAYSLWGNPRRYVWPMIVMVVGLMLLLNTTGVAHVSIGSIVVPLILLGVGVSILTNARARRRTTLSSSDEEIVAILGGSSTKNTSDNYHGGVVTAIMGGVELDLSKVTIHQDATLHVSVMMGGIDLRVPEGVMVVNRTQSILGGIDVKDQPTSIKATPTLVIDGQIIMGGIDIKR